MNKKLTRSKIISLSLTILSILFSFRYLDNRFYYSKSFPFYTVDSIKKDSLSTIGIIGDSWVAGRKLDSLLHFRLLRNGIKNKIISSGEPGAKSRSIYQNLFKDEVKGNSSKFIIQNSPDYCIVISGVNDAASEIGAHFYSYHVIQIIKTLIHYKIKPVIVSLPEFGIEETIDKMNFISRYRNVISAYFNNKGELDNIKTYRKTLNVDLKSENLESHILLINFDSVCREYKDCQELYRNSSHLSDKGNAKLVDLISIELSKIIRKQN